MTDGRALTFPWPPDHFKQIFLCFVLSNSPFFKFYSIIEGSIFSKTAQIHAIRGFYDNKNLLLLNNFNQKACIVKGFLIGLIYICPLTQFG